MPPNPKDAWKIRSGASTGPAGPPGIGRSKSDRSGNGKGKWVVAAIVLLGLIGAIAGVVFYFLPQPDAVVLALPVMEYSNTDWPVNPQVEGDAKALRALYGGESNFADQEKSRILRALNQAVDDSKSSSNRPLIISLSLLGFAREGVPYLLPGDAPTNVLKLDEILQPLRRTNVPRLLILDVRPVQRSRAESPTSDVNEELDAALTKLEQSGDLPFFVISANHTSRGPIVLRPIQQSVFGLAVSHGLAGAADDWTREGKDFRISVKELVAYVRDATSLACESAGLPIQVPKLYGQGKEFVVRSIARDAAPVLPAMVEPATMPDWLVENWKARDTWLTDKLHHRSPRLIRQQHELLLKAEVEWLGGLNPANISNRTLGVVQSLKSTAKLMPTSRYPVVSVARRRRDAELQPKIVTARSTLNPLLDRIRNATPAEEYKPAFDMIMGKAGELEERAVGIVLWEAAFTLTDPTMDQLKRIHQITSLIRTQPKPAELTYLELFTSFPTAPMAYWPKNTVRSFILLIDAAEQLAATDGRNLPWLEKGWIEANSKKRAAISTLGDLDSSEAEIRDAAGQLDTIRQSYLKLMEISEEWSKARWEFEETRAELADLAVGFPHDLAVVPEALASRWPALTEDVRKLGQMLDPALASAPPQLVQMNELTRSLRSNRELLRQMIVVPAAPRVDQLEAALSWPWWTWVEREKLLKRLMDADRALTEKILKSWPTTPTNRTLATPPSQSKRVMAESVRDEKRLLDLLRMMSEKDYQELNNELGTEPTAEKLTTVAGRTRSTWRTRIVDEYRREKVKRRLELGWALHPMDIDAWGPESTLELTNPEYSDQRRRHQEYLQWLAEYHYQADSAAWMKLKTAAAACRQLGELAKDITTFKP